MPLEITNQEAIEMMNRCKAEILSLRAQGKVRADTIEACAKLAEAKSGENHEPIWNAACLIIADDIRALALTEQNMEPKS